MKPGSGLDRAEQAREVAGQLTAPSASKAVPELAESFDRLARAAARLCSGESCWRGKTRNETGDFSRAFLCQNSKRVEGGGRKEWFSPQGF